MRLKQGQIAPNFEISDIHGRIINLHQLHNQKILLTFFRYAECALCNLRISELKKESKKLKELDIKLVAIFQSSNESLMQSIHHRHPFDFILIADPKLKLYHLYQVTPSWIKLIRTASWRGIKNMIRASKKGFKLGGKVEGKFHQIPADFLINRDNTIEIAHYGNSVIDHIPIDKIIRITDNR
ncbi:redoxin domain-containing protein [Aquimarina agarilytica]|uniref:redoxin domain-containing protein n=1 Tax=Aquimarina agarilytica TaxID=1087449 RepID=UPI0002897334|nr:redoxin domain-containing protein [Aquimarina agarilytica]